MKPMLARTYGPKYNRWPCYAQPKLNGVRALYQTRVFQSRDEKLWQQNILNHVMDELGELRLGPTVLDGELYVHGWKLQRINGAIAVNRTAPREDTKDVEFHVFDVVDPNKSFSSRWFEIYHTLQQANLSHVKAVPTALIQNSGDMQMHFNHYTSLGYEGIMLRPDGPYEFGEHWSERSQGQTQFRSNFLWKHKQWEDAEFRCIGFTQGEGKAAIGIGALVLIGDNNKKYIWTGNFKTSINVFGVGTGFSDDERIEFQKNPPIGKLVRVRYLCLTDDGIPFNPSFIAIMD